MMKKQILKNETETFALGATLAPFLRAGDCVVLTGALGAGKTCLARGLIQTLAGKEENVPSPTFTLVQTYETTPPLWHVDLYRLDALEEITELGVLEALDENAVLIEWADKIKHLLPPERLEIELSTPEGDFSKRAVVFTPQGKKWQELFNEN